MSTDNLTERNREIADNIARVRERIAGALHRAGREQNAVTLCAVTKTRPVSDCLAAIAAGVSDLGENYVQEAREKIPAVRAALPSHQSLTCHLVGRLQTNKIKYAVHFADVFQTVDSIECLRGIAKEAQKLYNVATITNGGFQTVQILVEINLAGSEGRAGIAPETAIDFAEIARETPGIALCGYMGMAPATQSADEARPYFASLKKLWDELPPENRRILSMGMSGDYEAAIAEGATLVRIGTALFGARN
ncbi:MAG: YggS family pyridoxal phosphate-dependent enzyme [Armatimonadetes bacterium]|nr:YggS family pyridoxal phosphate-dependent enzyme [Armatimonadota bacterium]